MYWLLLFLLFGHLFLFCLESLFFVCWLVGLKCKKTIYFGSLFGSEGAEQQVGDTTSHHVSSIRKLKRMTFSLLTFYLVQETSP